MASCKDCIHSKVCEFFSYRITSNAEQKCKHFKDRSRFVELIIAKKITHSPDIEKMRGFHKLGFGKGMGERSIFWTCSNCESWVSLAHKYCSNCGAKIEAEQALKEREGNDKQNRPNP